jgi:hypothetical protein
MEEQTRKLRLELSSLRSFARVDSEARRLGLTEPARDQVRLAREFLTGSGTARLATDESGLRTVATTPSDAGAARTWR